MPAGLQTRRGWLQRGTIIAYLTGEKDGVGRWGGEVDGAIVT